MSNINASNINTNNINVQTINGISVRSIMGGGYYVPCPDCGGGSNDDGTCVECGFVQDPCDCYISGGGSGGGPTGAPGVLIQFVPKNTGFSNAISKTSATALDNYNGLGIAGYRANGSYGYFSSITPKSPLSNIKVTFKVKYICSDNANNTLTIGVAYSLDNGITYALLGQDTNLGTYNASTPYTGLYTFNYIHIPGQVLGQPVIYGLFYQVNTSLLYPSDISYGIIGDSTSSNCIILEEYLGSGSTKSFVIDHPNDKDKYLVHACLEGPESGVYYRGKGEIKNNESVKIILPDYVEYIAYNFTIQITPIYSGKKLEFPLQVSEIENNSFFVYGDNSKFNWLVHGKRHDIEIEPLKSKVDVKGSGPYKWI
jgi:hypothetical protein